MAVVLEKGNTDVGLRAGEFIAKNREMALRMALAQQEATRDYARMKIQREQLAQQERQAMDEALREEARQASEMKYKYDSMSEASERARLDRESRTDERARADALTRELDIKAANRDYEKFTREEKREADREARASDREKEREDRMIGREKEKDNRELEQEKDKEIRSLLQSYKNMLLSRGQKVPKNATEEELAALVAASSTREKREREQEENAKYPDYVKVDPDHPYYDQLTQTRKEQAFISSEDRKTAGLDAVLARQKEQWEFQHGGEMEREARKEAFDQASREADQFKKNDAAWYLARAEQLYQQKMTGKAWSPPASPPVRESVADVVAKNKDNAKFYEDEALEAAGVNFPIIAKIGSWAGDVIDPTGQIGAGKLLGDGFRQATRKRLKTKYGRTDEEIDELEENYANAYVPSQMTRDYYGWQPYKLPPLK